MAALEWDKSGEHLYETGVDHGVLYTTDALGEYTNGVVWNGLTTVTESPSGAEPTKQYADNIPYLTLISAEEFSFTIEAFTYPDEFADCDGTAEPVDGVRLGQQTRKPFGFAYRTLVGNDIQGTDYGYKLKLIYGAIAAPSENANATINDSPEAKTFSWECSTTPISVPGFKPTSIVTIDSTTADATKLAALEKILYGDETNEARLPLPAEIMTIMEPATP